MFIVPISRGGYTGNVNLSFRKGREDAFKDPINAFNFALASDVANNRENQQNITRLANNQGLQFDVTQKARQDALNFAKASYDIPTAVSNAEINFSRLNALEPQYPAMGESLATTNLANLANQENKAKFDSATSANQ